MREISTIDIIWWRLFGFGEPYRIEGNSMLPTLKDGDEVLSEPPLNLRIGDIVIAKHPFRITPIIKRITNISVDNKFFLSGDNPDESTDSRSFGEINKKDIFGKVVCRLN
jgi:nickel-type superoxide dismutase maturation protease